MNVMDIECTGRRFDNMQSPKTEMGLWTAKRNAQRKEIEWRFNKKQVDSKLSKYYTT